MRSSARIASVVIAHQLLESFQGTAEPCRAGGGADPEQPRGGLGVEIEHDAKRDDLAVGSAEGRERAAAERVEVVPAPELGLSPALECALARLSAADREVLALRIVLDLDADSAARLMGISPSAGTTRLNRALQRLEEQLDDDD